MIIIIIYYYLWLLLLLLWLLFFHPTPPLNSIGYLFKYQWISMVSLSLGPPWAPPFTGPPIFQILADPWNRLIFSYSGVCNSSVRASAPPGALLRSQAPPPLPYPPGLGPGAPFAPIFLKAFRHMVVYWQDNFYMLVYILFTWVR